MEGQADRWIPSGQTVGLWESDLGIGVVVTTDNYLMLRGYNNERVYLPLKGISSFYFVGQRDESTHVYTLELWDLDKGVYARGEAPSTSSDTIDCRNSLFSVGSLYEPTSPNVQLAFLRWYSSTRPAGTAPLVVPPAPADLLSYEFDGTLHDDSGNQADCPVNGVPIFVTTPASLSPPAPAVPPVSTAVTQGVQSIDLSQIRGRNRLPITSTFSAISNFRLEGQAHNWIPQGTNVGIWELDMNAGLFISFDNYLIFRGFAGERAIVSLNGISSFRFVAQRNEATHTYTLEIWDQLKGGYQKGEVPSALPGAMDARNCAFSIGSMYEPTSPAIQLGFLRWYSTIRPVGGAAPPLITSSLGDLLNYEFEGNSADSSGNKADFIFSGTPAFVPTPAPPPAIIIGSAATPAIQTVDLSSWRGAVRLPNTLRYAAIKDFRVEGMAAQWTPHGAYVGIWELDYNAAVIVTADNYLAVRGFNWEHAYVSLAGISAFRFVAQRNTVTGVYTLEVWDEKTGKYSKSETPMIQATAVDCRNLWFSIGSLYEANSPDLRLGFLRWYSTTRSSNVGAPSEVPSTPGDLANYEADGNLKDTSGNSIDFPFNNTVQSSSGTTPAAQPPGLAPTTVRAGWPTILDATGSFSNNVNPALTCSWQTVAAPQPGTWINGDTCVATFVAPVFGTYQLQVTVRDSSGAAAVKQFKIGAVATDDKGVVIVGDPRIATILGPMIRFGANPWSWADDRQKRLADQSLQILDLGNGAGFLDYWNTASTHGTVSVTYGSSVITGVGTQFQNDFCGGPGQTIPVFATSQIYVWYPHADFPGQLGRARFQVGQCTSQTSITLVSNGAPIAFTRAGGPEPVTFSGLSYTVVSPQEETPWVYSAIPANYYDNVLALYNMYYRSGLEEYHDAARKLASRFWSGPNWDKGFVWNYADLRRGSTYTVAGPARGASVTGLILWALDTGTNIWPGVHHIWDNWAYYTGQYAINSGQMGDLREDGYMIGGLGLCALFDPDPNYRSNICPNALALTISSVWTPLQTPDRTWVNTAVNAFYASPANDVYVTLQNGSPNITLTGSGWDTNTFTANSPLDKWLWFTKDPTDVRLAGNSTAAVGDTVAYQLQSVTDSTHAVLKVPYSGTSGRKGLAVSTLVGFGNQPYMLGLALGAMGDYAYKGLVANNRVFEANNVQRMVTDGTRWLSSNGGNSSGLFGGRGFINCEPDPNAYVSCAPSLVQSGEAMRAYSATYLLNSDPAVKAAGDALYQALWAKPGYSSPTPSNGSYLNDIDDPGTPNSYMISSNPLSNKWFGFFFGYGFAASWPAARLGGLTPLQTQTVSLNLDVRLKPNEYLELQVIQPAGTVTNSTCVKLPCSVTIDRRQGDHLVYAQHYTAGHSLSASRVVLVR